jgi:outer membrane protein assembly factor BamB
MTKNQLFNSHIFLVVAVFLVLILYQIPVISAQDEIVISSAYPNSQQANYHPLLSVRIDDALNRPLTVVFETNQTGNWAQVGNSQSGSSGSYIQNTYGMDAKNKIYFWKVRVFDGTLWTEQVYSFTAVPFALKWSYNTNANSSLGPLAVDVNGDGIYEVFTVGEDKVSCFNGDTGALIWQYTNSKIFWHSAFQIHDLNNDGIPEIVLPAVVRTIALHANDGSVYWNVPVESEEKHIVIVDTDGNGFPYVYTTSQDVEHMENGTGRLRKLNGTNGQVIKEVFSWRPCWGGLSADDADNDGKFEIYMTDRSSLYHPPSLGKGMQAYDADTLDLLWYDDEILCSSHLMALIDINKDGIKDAVALDQASGSAGIFVHDGAKKFGINGTLERMDGMWGKNLGLSAHSPFSIWDIDGDGNLELVTSRNSVAKVWDMGKWAIEATLDEALNVTFDEPPKMADVIGDSRLEIIGGGADTKIYDGVSYQRIETIPTGNAIDSTLVQDIDNDGQNELITISSSGFVKVYDTSAYAPTPRVRTNTLYYGEQSLGAGVYMPPIGAPQPIVKSEYPRNSSPYVNPSINLSAGVFNYRHYTTDANISINIAGQWIVIASYENVYNGILTANLSSYPLEAKTMYSWKVTAVSSGYNDMGIWKSWKTENVYSFTTTSKGVNCIDNDADGYYVGADCGEIDCNEIDPLVNPNVLEVCDGIDNDCDNQIDEGLTVAFYSDLDLDTFGNISTEQIGCTMPEGYVNISGDCDDSNAYVNPDYAEVCGDLIDNNCNGFVDENCECLNYTDCSDQNVCIGSIIVTNSFSCIGGQCMLNSTIEHPSCDDGNFCNGLEICDAGSCISEPPVDCSAYNISEINSCIPDDFINPFTREIRKAFVSVCNETSAQCTTSDSITTTRVCDKTCGAICDANADCDDGNSSTVDTCLSSCTCEHIDPAVCGNGVCSPLENCSSCAQDCGTCQITLFCGDNVCNNGETCSNCASDCGVCRRSSSGGGGGGGVAASLWKCGNWSACNAGTQTRACSLNGANKDEKQNCTSVMVRDNAFSGNSQKNATSSINSPVNATSNGPSEIVANLSSNALKLSGAKKVNTTTLDPFKSAFSGISGFVVGSNLGKLNYWYVMIIVIIIFVLIMSYFVLKRMNGAINPQLTRAKRQKLSYLDRRSVFSILLVLYLLAMIYGALSSEIVKIMPASMDKIFHFVEFFILALLIYLTLSSFKVFHKAIVFIFVLLISLGLGILSELIQLWFAKARNFSWLDFLADAIGISLALIVMVVYEWISSKR